MKKINIEKILMIFILIQPLLDFYLLYSESVTNIFKFSPTTIIRIVFIVFFTIYLLFKIKYNKKYLWSLIYLIFIGIYLIWHVLNSLNFNTNIGGNFNFSYITEAFYYIRMFIPIILIFITYNSKISEDTFRKTIVYVSLIFSLEIIITNILNISLTSYGGNNIISGNIFDWFSNKSYTFEELASKGFFYMANQISGVLVMLLPINIYYAIKTSKKICVLSSFSLALAMIMIGTRVGTYGWFLIAITVFIAWIFFSLIHKNKIGITKKKIFLYLVLLSVLTIITLNSPLVLRKTSVDYEALEKENMTDEITDKFNNLDGDEEIENFILMYSEYYSIPITYIKDLYPYTKDSSFWLDVMRLPYSVRGGNRNLQNLMTKRVYELNNNKYDKVLGMGYSRFRNAEIYVEQDFVVHYYTMGILGIILFLVPYFAIATFALIYMLIKKKLRMKTTILCMSVYLVLAISYFSGHVLDELIITIILGFICGYILNLVFKNSKQEEIVEFINEEYNESKPKISVIIPVYNVEEYIDKCLHSLVNQTMKNIEIIVVNDGTKDNSQEIIDRYSSNYKNIKSFIKENGGVSSARNYGLEQAKGEYIAFVDSDDYIEFDMYEKLYKKAIQNNFDVVVCDLKRIYTKKEVIMSSLVEQDLHNKQEIKDTMVDMYPVIWNKLYKKKIFNNNIKFKLGVWFEDVEFLYKIYPYISSIGVVKEPLYNYIERNGSITSVFDKRLYNYIDNWNGIIKFYKNNKLFKKYKEEIEYSYVRYLYATFVKRAANFKDKEEFKKACDEAIKNVEYNFTNYKKNKYLKRLNLKNLYLKNFNFKIANLLYRVVGVIK